MSRTDEQIVHYVASKDVNGYGAFARIAGWLVLERVAAFVKWPLERLYDVVGRGHAHLEWRLMLWVRRVELSQSRTDTESLGGEG